VEADGQHLVRRELIEQARPRHGPHLGVLVRARWPLGPRHGDMVVADGVADHHHRRVAGGYREGHVPGRVPRRRDRRYAGGDLGPVLEGFKHSVDDLDPPDGARREARARLADGVHRVGVHPVIPLGPAHPVGGIEEERLIEIIENAPEVIGVPMGEDHVRDVVWRQPLGIERIQKTPGAGLEGMSRAAVEQDRAVRLAQQRHVAGRGQGRRRVHAEVPQKNPQFLLRRGAEDEVRRQHEIAIAQGDKFRGPEADALRGEARPRQQCGGGGKRQVGTTCHHRHRISSPNHARRDRVVRVTFNFLDMTAQRERKGSRCRPAAQRPRTETE
jgi:hypothetical protein